MLSGRKFDGDARRAAAIGALTGILYTILMPVTRNDTFNLGSLPINVYPFFSTILILWGIAGLIAGLQWYGVPDWSRPVFRAFETLFFWVSPGMFIYMILLVALAWNFPVLWANFVPLFQIGIVAIALAFGFYFSRRITTETGLKAAINRYFGKRKVKR